MPQFRGHDTDGKEYSSPQELWQTYEKDKERSWYGAAVSYWDQQEATVDGVLGGFGDVSEADVDESHRFLNKAFRPQLAKGSQLVALDCGAGVGRVSEHLLLHHFAEVDLVEPSRHLLQTAQERLPSTSGRGGGLAGIPLGHHVVNCFCMGLQEFTPAPQRYDCVWIQWALLFLTDDDAVAFLQRCKAGLKPQGIIIIKENACQEGFVVDKADTSIMRSHEYMLHLLDQAELQLLYTALQKNFPKQLFKVRMYAVRPRP